MCVCGGGGGGAHVNVHVGNGMFVSKNIVNFLNRTCTCNSGIPTVHVIKNAALLGTTL